MNPYSLNCTSLQMSMLVLVTYISPEAPFNCLSFKEIYDSSGSIDVLLQRIFFL